MFPPQHLTSLMTIHLYFYIIQYKMYNWFFRVNIKTYVIIYQVGPHKSHT